MFKYSVCTVVVMCLFALCATTPVQADAEGATGATLQSKAETVRDSVGGAMQDLPDEEKFKFLVTDFIRRDLPGAISDLEKLVLRNRIFIDRTVGIGTLSREDAIAWSATGPVARASGVRRDLRKDEPYLCYKDNWDGQGAPAVEFAVPLAEGGDAYARFQVRIAEIRESIRIIEQLIDNIPQGPMSTFSDGKMMKPPKPEVYERREEDERHVSVQDSRRTGSRCDRDWSPVREGAGGPPRLPAARGHPRPGGARHAHARQQRRCPGRGHRRGGAAGLFQHTRDLIPPDYHFPRPRARHHPSPFLDDARPLSRPDVECRRSCPRPRRQRSAVAPDPGRRRSRRR